METGLGKAFLRLALSAALFVAVISPAGAAMIAPTAPRTVASLGDAAPGDDWTALGREPGVVRSVPPYAGMALLSDVAAQMDLWMPANWHVESVIGEQGATLILSPDAADARTSVAISYGRLAREMTPFDLPAMSAHFQSLLAALPGSQVQWQARWRNADGVGFEARLTFDEGDGRAVRWLRLLYVGDREYLIVAQGASEADYDLHARALLAIMLTFRPL